MGAPLSLPSYPLAMQLAYEVTGTGERTALLIHGIQSAGRAWHRVAADLASQGHRVVTVDLAGHGASPRSRRYSPDGWADDVVETTGPLLTRAPDLVVGHSLGALVASLAVERLGAGALVYIDPAFVFPTGALGIGYKVVFGLAPRPSRALLARVNPRWSKGDLDIEQQTLREWDRRTLLAFVDSTSLRPPDRLVAPSLVVLAERSFLITPRDRDELVDRGMRVVTVPQTGHNVHRDDHDGVMRVIRDWLVEHDTLAGTQTERSTATTLPSTSAESPRIGSNAELRGNSQV